MLKQLFLLLLLLGAGPAWADVEIHLKAASTEQHLLQVSLTTDTVAPGNVIFSMPVWRTGRYQQLDFVHAMTDLKVLDSRGNLLEINKLSDHQWSVSSNRKQRLSINYLLTANELSSRTRHLDETHLFVDFAAVAMVVEGQQEQAVRVELDIPESWHVRSGLKAGKNSHVLWAENYQILIDSPVEAGIHQYRSFKSHGKLIELVVWGDTPADLEQLEQDIAAIVVASYELWGSFPFERYVFMLHATDNVRGGTEHLNSTIMQWDRFKFNDDKNYLDFMGLVAHEFVHTWNVKAYRPAAFVPYELTKRHHSPLLWFAEGSTSYLQEKLLLKSGVMTEDDFLERLSKRLERHAQKPGGRHQSVADASWYSWIQHSGQHRHNFFANIYDEGFLVTWLMDQWLLQQSDNKYGVGALHRNLYKAYSLPNGLTEQQIIDEMGRLTQNVEGAEQWWQTTVHSPFKLRASSSLDDLGFMLDFTDKKASMQAVLVANNDGLMVQTVIKGGAAWHAKLSANDRIIAINGFAVNSENYERIQQSWSVGQTLQLHVFRQGRLTELNIELAEVETIQGIKELPGSSDAQLQLRQSWLDNH
ncbi:M61 family metallopeptidase [Echinimonas agarilytica]|uniref:PDZ domain-containing protein n=1 Tax=Echinimonas agarilytica TaxID=1215918 RepID=A0AA41W589_9GAMM|nr:PDZ domain-containing protein [Echinimonas agarilytica]MCM2679110.1 PDZ domain-containing protein [Echinimonas agarilytica]